MSVHLARGARDFLPETMRHRRAVIRTIEDVFRRYGFEPLGTPAIERIETLTGKYGEEGDQLLFRILKRGEGAATGECDMALRYDLTVPLARVLAMNPGLRMPFKRFQVAPVWRADRPQRGRFREFYQCDADIAGTTSPLADAECLAVAADALTALGFDRFTLRLNDRRILRSMARVAGARPDQEIGVLIAVDKLDKIGRDGVDQALAELGLAESGREALWKVLDLPRGHETTLDALAPLLDDEGREGVATLREVLALARDLGVSADRVAVDPTLARGLDYYTGPVYEAVLDDRPIGSVAGGGRYDGLVGMFSGKTVPAVGVSLGLERLITILEEEGREAQAGATADVLVTVFSPELRGASVRVARALRQAGIATELYLDDRKLKAQLKHADARGYRFIAILGPDEAREGRWTLKRLSDGEQWSVTTEDAISRLLR